MSTLITRIDGARIVAETLIGTATAEVEHADGCLHSVSVARDAGTNVATALSVPTFNCPLHAASYSRNYVGESDLFAALDLATLSV